MDALFNARLGYHTGDGSGVSILVVMDALFILFRKRP